MVFKNLCILVLWTKVASALEGLKYTFLGGRQRNEHLETEPMNRLELPAGAENTIALLLVLLS